MVNVTQDEMRWYLKIIIFGKIIIFLSLRKQLCLFSKQN